MMTCLSLRFPGLWGRRKVILSSDKMLPLLTSSQKHTRMHMKDAFRGGFFSAERVHFQKAKPKSLHPKSMLLKFIAFLSLFSFIKKKKKNNVQMSLMEINKMKEFLISLELTRK